jgi:WS/DGAT/MGAT family acyltransferase
VTPATPSHPAQDERRLSPLDASFLYFDQPNQPIHVGAVAIVDGPLDLDAVRAVLGARLGALPRYRQHPVRSLLDLSAPRWEDDRTFDPAFHVRHARVPAPGDEMALHATIDALFATPCDLDRSPWETHLIDGLADGRTALLTKVHHCMIDGISGAQTLDVMSDPLPETPPAAPPGVAPPPPALRFTPSAALARVREAVEAVGAMSGISQVTPLPFNGPLSPNRRIRWASFALDDLLALRGAAGCKVNDVILAIIAGALRRMLLEQDAAADHLRVRTLVPVSTRTADEHLALGNRVSAMFATLPTDLRDPLARLHAVMNETRRLKAHGQPQALGLALAIAGALPSATGPLWASLSARYPVVHTICTNVPGPRGTRWLLGRRILEVHPIVPIALDIGLAFAILSYDRAVSISATADPALVPDADRLPAALLESADELHEAVGTRSRPVAAAAARATGPTVADLMAREVVTTSPEASLADAWTSMQRARIRHLPVVDGRGALLGLVTHRDLLAAAQSRVTFPDEADRLRMLSWAHADDVMETHLSTVDPGTSAAEAGRRMAEHKIGCLPVVADGRLVGLVTEHDYLRWAVARMEQPAH